MNAATTTPSALGPRFSTRCANRQPQPSSSTEGSCFISRLLDSLTWSFKLDAGERELARGLLCKHPLGAIARAQGVDSKTAQQLCKALFASTGTDGREQLFEVALRLTTMRELSSLFTAKA